MDTSWRNSSFKLFAKPPHRALLAPILMLRPLRSLRPISPSCVLKSVPLKADASAGRVYALALRITGTPQAAEEVASDVYWQVWNQAERYDPARGKVMAWLMTLCRSRALDHLRREDSPLLSSEQQETGVSAVADERPSPLDITLALERNSAVRAALLTLNSSQRQLLSLAFFRGLSHQEIATYTGLPLGSVKSAIRKAMLALKEILSRHNVITTEEVS